MLCLPFLTVALAASAAPAGRVEISRKDALLDFAYSWPREAAAIPQLDRRFRADAAKQRAEALSGARAERAARRELKADFNGNQFSREWRTSGQSRRLLSLVADSGEYTGGAHPNGGTNALLWDRVSSREIKLSDLTRSPADWTGAIRQPFCVLLDRERVKRRQAPVKKDDMFGNCPKLSELTLSPADHDRDGRFDHIDITADSYVAGPYVEGTYEIELPITATMLARLKPDFRAQFEAQPPVQ